MTIDKFRKIAEDVFNLDEDKKVILNLQEEIINTMDRNFEELPDDLTAEDITNMAVELLNDDYAWEQYDEQIVKNIDYYIENRENLK